MDELLTRGVERIYPSKEALAAKLSRGEKLKIYFGIDPTAPTLHLGHVSVLLKLRDFQALGHEIIILLGDFTARIGDPTDKKAARKKLSAAEVKANLKLYKKQINKILDPDRTKFAFNSRWLGKLRFDDALELASEFTYAQIIERDMFQDRLKSSAPIYLHELLYPLMQGYDSVALNVDAEIGANDQTFNMLIGRQMLARRGKEKFVIATKLLVDATGKKMGKTEGNMAMLTDTPAAMYGKIMSWSDVLVPLGYEILTRLPVPAAADPMAEKKALARAVVATCFSEAKAAAAERAFVKTFQQKKPEDFKELRASTGALLIDVIVAAGVVSSKSEFRRLVEAGAVHDLESGQTITDPQFALAQNAKLRLGKRSFVRITLK